MKDGIGNTIDQINKKYGGSDVLLLENVSGFNTALDGLEKSLVLIKQYDEELFNLINSGDELGELLKKAFSNKEIYETAREMSDVKRQLLEKLGTTIGEIPDPAKAMLAYEKVIDILKNNSAKGSFGEHFHFANISKKDTSRHPSIKLTDLKKVADTPDAAKAAREAQVVADGFSNSTRMIPDEINKATGVTIDVKVGYLDGNIDWGQFENYINLIRKTAMIGNDPEVVKALSDATGGMTQIRKHRYVFMPSQSGQSAKQAAEAFKAKASSRYKNDNSIFNFIEIEYLDELGQINKI